MDSEGAPDAELARAAAAGDRAAFAALITRHWATAAALAARLLGSQGLAHDAVQEASIAALTGLGRLRDPAAFGPWFCGITLNVARRWRRQLAAEHPAELADRTDGGPGPQELAEIAELGAAVRAAIAQLADGQRHAVLLFYLQGLTHREVAAELGISVGAVKARLHQARAALAPGLAPLISASRKETVMTAAIPGDAGPRDWTEVTVLGIRRGEAGEDGEPVHVMLLAERDGERVLPIWIGPAEGIALALSLHAAEMPRPMTYQLAASLVGAAGARVSEVRIVRLAGMVYYATVIIDGPGGRREADARPSDAVNLAVVTGTPVRVDASLFAAAQAQAQDHPEFGRWQQLPAGTDQVAAEARAWLSRRPCEP